MVRSIGLLLCAVTPVSCAVGSKSFDEGTSIPVDEGGAPIFDNDGGGGSNTAGCSEAAKLVYVVTIEGSLYKFDPPAAAFTKVGTLQCPSSGQPNSMAIDRSATAWVNYTTGEIFKVSTQDASCQPSGWAPRQLGKPFSTMGMGFSVNTADGTAETLFVSDVGLTGGQGLATIDLGSMGLQPISAFGAPHTGAAAELTGTGDGRLYGFFPQGAPALAQIDKSSAKVLSNAPLPIPGGTAAWAFSFWGGVFYLYTSPCDGVICQTGSTVTKYDPASKASTAVKQVPFIIDGAGVSTCAPVLPVN
jgi:hypothetical protein